MRQAKDTTDPTVMYSVDARFRDVRQKDLSVLIAPSITKGAVISSQRRPATKVSVSQVPNGTRPINRSPRGHRP